MKYGVFSDAHSNYAALKAVLEKFRQEGAEGYICCGDLVGYGPDAEACVEEIRKLPNLTCVMGNHDKALTDMSLLDFFAPDSIEPIRYANSELSPKNFAFISALPQYFKGDDFSVVHGTFNDPYKEYLLTPAQFKQNADKWPGRICFVGHSHMPFIMHCKNGEDKVSLGLFPEQEMEIKLSPDRRYIINPGSAGQPRDGNTAACAGIYDADTFSFKLFRAPYDVSETVVKMRDKMFEKRLLERLETGL